MATQAIVQPDALPEPVDNVEDGVENLKRYGVNIHRNYLSPDMVAQLLARVHEQADMERALGIANIGGPGGPQDLLESVPGDVSSPIYQIVDFLPNKGRVFIDLMMHELSLAYARGLFGDLPFRMWTTGGIVSRRGLNKQFYHRDEGALPADMCTRPTLLNMFIALSDFDADMGATWIAPGSHLFQQPPWITGTDGVTFHQASVRPGDVVMWEGRTWHAGGAHNSDKARTVVTMGYSLAGVTPQHLYPAALHDDVYATLNDAEREVLGFKAVGGGYTNRIAPRHPHDPMTNTNRTTAFIPELHRS